MKKAQHSRKHKVFVDKPLCSYVHRYCTRTCLDGYKYCIRHILEDKNAPFRQCSYVHPINHKRCSNAAPKNDKRDSFCPWHLKRSQVTRELPKKKIKQDSAEDLLLQLESYCEDDDHDSSYNMNADLAERYDALPSSAEIIDIQHLGSGTEDHKTLVEQSWLGHSDESESDLEVDDEFTSALKHAGIYTYEEATKIYEAKLKRFQSLCIEEMKYLEFKYKKGKRNYLQAVKTEKETFGSVHNAPRKTQKEEEDYLLLKHTYRYHRRFGAEAVLQIKSLQKHNDALQKEKQANTQYCLFSSDKQCTAKVLPLTKFCLKHILSDPHQVLYKHCAERNCSKPIIPYGNKTTCMLHSRCGVANTKRPEIKKLTISGSAATTSVPDIMNPDPEHFQSMDDIASLGLDAVVPGSLFGLNQFGEPGESTDSALSDDHGAFMRIQRLNLSASNILCAPRKSHGTDSAR